MAWKVQKATPDGASCVFVHGTDAMAVKEIEGTLPSLLNELSEYWARGWEGVGHGFLEDAEQTLISAEDALKQGDPWSAYYWWREFADNWGSRLSDPAWKLWGDLIIEKVGREEASNFYSHCKRLPEERPSLGSPATRWLIQQADFVNPKHPYVTASEEVAKRKITQVLRDWILPNIMHQVNMWAVIGPRQRGEHAEFVKDGKKLFYDMEKDLSEGKVWKAYHQFKDFEEKYANEFPSFGIVGAIGSIRVLPDPEPEE